MRRCFFSPDDTKIVSQGSSDSQFKVRIRSYVPIQAFSCDDDSCCMHACTNIVLQQNIIEFILLQIWEANEGNCIAEIECASILPSYDICLVDCFMDNERFAFAQKRGVLVR